MKKRILWVGILLSLLSAAVLGILIPYLGAGSAMPSDGVLVLRRQENGGWLLSWPEGIGADHYLVEILEAPNTEDREPRILHSSLWEGTEGFVLPDLEGEVLLRVSSGGTFTMLGEEWGRYCAKPLEATVRLDAPVLVDPEWTGDAESRSVHMTFRLEHGDVCTVYQIQPSGEYVPLKTVTETDATLTFGDGGDLPFPEVGQSYGIALAASRKIPGAEIHGAVSWEFSVQRQDLLGRDLNAVLEPVEDFGFTLSWNETRGDYYEVQQLGRDGQWTTLYRVELGEDRRYVSGPLAKYGSFTYRVVAVGGNTPDENGLAAWTDGIHFATMASPKYATVWPVKNLDAYYDGTKTAVYTTVKAGSAYCVVDEKDGFFGVRIGDQIGYIDSNYCMINLPDYFGDLCSYKIANSTSSIYQIHDQAIPNVTGVVTGGYEHIHQADGSDLVPLLYPTARKLKAAAQEAVNQGYRLRIYDSFRPQVATWEIYDRTAAILDRIGSNGRTYRQTMLSGGYALTSFLAKGTSRHNLGVALDLTLEDAVTGEELGMQSAMHDVSGYSVTGRNNANANKLASIMTGAGFTGLSTEWWHFQDDEPKNQLALQAVRNGISAEGWACDPYGWRYRDTQGSYVKGQTIQADGAEYTFDGNGYLTEGQPAFG